MTRDDFIKRWEGPYIIDGKMMGDDLDALLASRDALAKRAVEALRRQSATCEMGCCDEARAVLVDAARLGVGR